MRRRWAAAAVIALGLLAPPASAAPGELDRSFGGDGLVEGGTGDNASLAIQPDGRILVTGSCGNPYDVVCVRRLLPDGTSDPGFGQGGVAITDRGHYVHSQAFALALQGDGKVVVAGRTLTRDGGPQRTLVLRYLSDGTLDPSYGERGLAIHDLGDGDGQEGVQAVAIQPDGRAVVAGWVHHAGGHVGIVARLGLDGALDPSFGRGGRVIVPLEALSGMLSAIALEPDGRIVVAGHDQQSGLVLRLTPGGVLDASFAGGGVARVTGTLRDVARQADGRIVVAGWHTTSDYDHELLAARLLPDGALDPSFGSGGAARVQLATDRPDAGDPELITTGDSLALQANGKVVVGGFARRWDASANAYAIPMVVVRLGPDGSPDAGFGQAGRVVVPGTGAWNFASHAGALQQDGGIVGAGGARTVRLLGDPAPGGAPVATPAPGPQPGGGTGGDGSAPGPGAGGPSDARRVRLAALGPLRLWLRRPASFRVARGRAVLPLAVSCVRRARRSCRASVRIRWRAAGRGAVDRRWRALRAQRLRLPRGRQRTLAPPLSRFEARRVGRAAALELRIELRAGSRRVVRRAAARRAGASDPARARTRAR